MTTDEATHIGKRLDRLEARKMTTRLDVIACIVGALAILSLPLIVLIALGYLPTL